MYHSCRQLLEMAEARNVPIHEIVIENEMKNGDIGRAEVMEGMKERYGIMYASAARALDQPLPTEGGLVQIPYAQRNASQAVNALLSADLALSGAKFPIPTDEVIDAMYKAGRLLPAQLRETAMGGIAATETGKAIADGIFNNSQGCSRP